MAYVAVTQSLISDVRDSIHRLKARELESIPEDLTKLCEDQDLHKRIDVALWEGFDDLRGRLGQFDKRGTVLVKTKVVASDGAVMFHEMDISFDNMTFPVFRRKEDSYYTRAELKLDISDHPLLVAFADAHQARTEIMKRWASVENQVVEYLRKFKSLNEGVKLWPDLRRYVPNSTLQRLDQKTEAQRTKESAALEALKKLDLDTINASTVLARMAGASIDNA